jgi:sugar phosphate isomerase/epimerase
LDTKYICIKSFHLPYYLNEEDMARSVARFENAGLHIVGGGNNNIREDNDEHVEMFFKYADSAHMPLLVIAPTRDNLKRIEKYVKQYDVKVAIHNHGPEDEYFPRPSDALERIKDMDPRVGLCVDVGHTVRTGADVVQEIAEAGSRVLDVHIKDLRDLMDKDSQCVVGEGRMPIVDIFKQLQKIKYDGYVNLEYEIDEHNVVPGMKQSFAYMRGVLAGMEG